MRIAMVGSRSYPAGHGGIEVAVENISTELAQMGNSVTLFVDKKFSAQSAHAGIELKGAQALRTKYTHTASQILLNLLSLEGRLYDVVHIHGVGPAYPLALDAGAYKRLPTVATVHGIDWDRQKWPLPARRLFKAVAVKALSNAGAVTAVSKPDADQIKNIIGGPVMHIPNGLPKIEQDLKIGVRKKYSIYAGRLTPEKNVHELIRQYDQQVADKLGPLCIIGGGESSHSSRYEQELRKNAPPWVQFKGPRPHRDTLKSIAEAGCFISLSRLEGQPLTVIEALTLSTPVFVSDIPAHRELCGPSATYIPLDEPGSLRRELLKEEMYARMNSQPLSHQPTWREAANSYLNIYEKVIEGDGRTFSNGSNTSR